MAESKPDGPNAPGDPAISRRDFLRRAGKEAAVTGTKILPGAAIAQKVLGISEPAPTAPETAVDKTQGSGLVARLAAWRRQRRADESATPGESPTK